MSITKEDVADAVRQWCTAWHTRDIPTILAMEAQAGGYGFRPLGQARPCRAQRGRRPADPRAVFRPDGLVPVGAGRAADLRHRGGRPRLGDIHRDIPGAGTPPERARVRFSKVLTRGPQGWQVRLYHRDIQPFADDGRYPRALTVMPPTP